MTQELKGTEAAKDAIKRVTYTHDMMIDAMLANPTISNQELATLFGYTAPWISQIKNSGAFQERLAERRKETSDPILIASIEDKFRGIVDRGLDVMAEKLNQPAGMVPADVAMKAIDLGARALGYGAKATSQGTQVNATFVVALPNKAESEASWSAAHNPGGVLSGSRGSFASSTQVPEISDAVEVK